MYLRNPKATHVREGHFRACELLAPMTEMIIVPDPGDKISTASSFGLPLGTRQSLLQALPKCALVPGL